MHLYAAYLCQVLFVCVYKKKECKLQIIRHHRHHQHEIIRNDNNDGNKRITPISSLC